MTATDSQSPKAPKDRSPSYPFIPLKTAIERLVALEGKFGRHPAPALQAGIAWDMKPASSQAAQTLAALKSFGLVDYQGAGDERIAAISDDGRTYLRAQQDSVKREVLKRLALKPKAIAKYWSAWGHDRPPEPVCLDQLVLKGGFTQSAANIFLRVYDETIRYAGLSDSDTDTPQAEAADEDEKPAIAVGDLVLVEVGGALVFPEPKRVRAINVHDGKPWVYVEGSQSGVSMDNVQLHQKGAAEGFTPPPLMEETRPASKAGWKEERLVDDGGDETFLSYKGEPSLERYEFIRDYLEFRISRIKKATARGTDDET